jgi:hypothetical protein
MLAPDALLSRLAKQPSRGRTAAHGFGAPTMSFAVVFECDVDPARADASTSQSDGIVSPGHRRGSVHGRRRRGATGVDICVGLGEELDQVVDANVWVETRRRSLLQP